jgi:O-antigen/teichoic acid export membrane protein
VARLLRNVSWVYAAQVVNGLVGVVFVPFAVARLGTEGYGLYGVYSVLTGYVLLAELGVAMLSGDRFPRELRFCPGPPIL